MRNTGPATFGARLASRPLDQEEDGWFFNVPPVLADDNQPEQTDDTDGLIQIGPLDT